MPRRYLTGDIPPLELGFRAGPDDFQVEEVPLYPACGAGDHVYVTIEKEGISTAEAVRGIARRLSRRAGDIGIAGLKDAHARTRQTISVEHLDPSQLALVDDPPRVRAVAFSRHRNKLKLGHLLGNRFRVRLRREDGGAPADEDVARVRAVVARLEAEGLPNAFGAQRFSGGRTAALGRALLRGDDGELLGILLGRPHPDDGALTREARARFEKGDLAGARELFPASFLAERAALRALMDTSNPARAVAAIGKEDRRLYVSAAQSEVFNEILSERLERAGTLSRLEAGDVAFIHAKGACFIVEDPAAEGPRADRFELSPSGPLFGTRTLEARGAVLERERAALERAGLRPDLFASRRAMALRGARRPLRVPLGEAAVDREPDALVLSFFLPAGSYATVLVEELLKPAAAVSGG